MGVMYDISSQEESLNTTEADNVSTQSGSTTLSAMFPGWGVVTIGTVCRNLGAVGCPSCPRLVVELITPQFGVEMAV